MNCNDRQKVWRARIFLFGQWSEWHVWSRDEVNDVPDFIAMQEHASGFDFIVLGKEECMAISNDESFIRHFKKMDVEQ